MIPFSPSGADGNTANTLSVAELLSWEIDLWGWLAHGREAALAELEQNRIGIEAMRLPSLSLGAMLGSVTRSESDLFSSGAGTSVSLLWSVLDFGWSRARIGIAKAQREQAKLYWHASVQVAFNEVRSARIPLDVAAIVRTEALAKPRYQEWLIGFIELLDTRREQLTATATLFKVQGGGCSREP